MHGQNHIKFATEISTLINSGRPDCETSSYM